MQIATLYLTTLTLFLTLHMQPLFKRHIGPLLLENIRLLPAAAFYAAYIAGLVYLVSYPALKTGSAVLITAAILGAMAYGTYEFTSYAIMKGWSPQMVATDLIWGT